MPFLAFHLGFQETPAGNLKIREPQEKTARGTLKKGGPIWRLFFRLDPRTGPTEKKYQLARFQRCSLWLPFNKGATNLQNLAVGPKMG